MQNHEKRMWVPDVKYFSVSSEPGSKVFFAGVEGGDLGAYFSTNNEILDGHHRWAATSLNNPAASLGGFAAVDLEAMGGTTQALKHLTAIGNAFGNKTKTA